MRLILAAALALGCSPSLAQECVTYQKALDTVDANGGKVVGAATYKGSQTTDMLIIETPDLILLMGFDAKGCLVGQMVVEPAKKPDSGA